VEAKSEVSDGSLLLLVAFLLVNAPNCHTSLVLASVVTGDAVNCNSIPSHKYIKTFNWVRSSFEVSELQIHCEMDCIVEQLIELQG